jgi:ABC-type uncharacterized transport system ATPase subunit
MLELRNITKTFGDVLANDRVSIKVEPGTIHAIVGENGAGKSTAMRIAYGFYTADGGEIVIDGQVREIRTPHDAIALGVGMVHQHFMLVEPMTVAENIVLGAEPGSAASLDLRKAADEIRKVSDEFKLSVDPNAIIETLSVGQQQRVELLKALYRRAQLLILDEPTAVLAPQEVDEFFTILRGMREQGKTIVIITHKLSEVLAISDNVTVMRDGRVVGDVKTSNTNAAELARMMVGREVLLRVEKPEAKPGAALISLSDFSIAGRDGSKRVDKVSFDVRAGEIVGIAGVEGNGQTELIEALAGLQQPSSGEIVFEGDTKTFWSYPKGTPLGNFLVVLWALSVLAVGIALLNADARSFEVVRLAAVRVIIQSGLTWGLFVALKKKERWAIYTSAGLFLFGVGLSLASLWLRASAGVAMPIINSILLLYGLTLAWRELRLTNRTELRTLQPRRIKELGVAHVPEDRHRRGLLLDFTLAENTILGVHYRKPAVTGPGLVFLDQKGIQRRTEQVIRDFDVRPPNPELPARALSGGNQQKLIIGREFELPPKFLLVSQPTRGVDIGAIEFIHQKIVAMRDAGCAVLLVSAELEEVTALSDRLLVIHNGRIVGEVDPKVTSNEEIGLMMTGGRKVSAVGT